MLNAISGSETKQTRTNLLDRLAADFEVNFEAIDEGDLSPLPIAAEISSNHS